MTLRIVALTGGTGFIGRACAAALAAAGWRVRMLVRPDTARPIATTPDDLVLGDLADGAALARLVRGADAVVHAAGVIRGHNAAAFLAVNRDATGRLADTVRREAPSCRFVLVSSQAARCPGLSPYAASKHAGEMALRDVLGPASWIILRPGVVYGPRDKATQALLALADLPLVPVPAAPELRLSMIHVADVAAAVVAFCDSDVAGAVHELCDAAPDGHAWRGIVSCATSRPTPRFVTVPDWGVLAAGAAADAWSALARSPSLFGRGKAREVLHRDWRPDRALLPPQAIWRPIIELSAGFETIRRATTPQIGRSVQAMHGPF